MVKRGHKELLIPSYVLGIHPKLIAKVKEATEINNTGSPLMIIKANKIPS
jgi:hypothetical protein